MPSARCAWRQAAAGKARIGIIFPEQVGSSSTRLDEQYRREQVNAAGEREVVISWYFDVTVRQHFDFSKYPLDHHDVWLRLWPQDFDRDVVLVPDLSSDNKTGRSDRFGFDRDIVPGAWKIEDTFYSYKRKCYDTRFGTQGYVGQDGFPELHFNLTLSRRFVNGFVVTLVPLISVLVLLFSVLVLSTVAFASGSLARAVCSNSRKPSTASGTSPLGRLSRMWADRLARSASLLAGFLRIGLMKLCRLEVQARTAQRSPTVSTTRPASKSSRPAAAWLARLKAGSSQYTLTSLTTLTTAPAGGCSLSCVPITATSVQPTSSPSSRCLTEGLIAGEVGDLWKDWMRHVDAVLDDPELLDRVDTTLATRWPN